MVAKMQTQNAAIVSFNWDLVIIVNPDKEAARRIQGIAGPYVHCSWIKKYIEEWLDDDE